MSGRSCRRTMLQPLHGDLITAPPSWWCCALGGPLPAVGVVEAQFQIISRAVGDDACQQLTGTGTHVPSISLEAGDGGPNPTRDFPYNRAPGFILLIKRHCQGRIQGSSEQTEATPYAYVRKDHPHLAHKQTIDGRGRVASRAAGAVRPEYTSPEPSRALHAQHSYSIPGCKRLCTLLCCLSAVMD
ncbi:uncharacterized protein B0I36DRAFT_153374 [Microdochium trichocladiopsis]|uniref:Uncharacterized protein n=1 Tax=Microdochium trichocladiopsis TaxID=1682393 RepID=A0A9P8XZJ8_9PEZI|nr:uncharacterized protein B0I36DRAFT_153374 [Microdochium trichocladiopsis]KAH7026059.1 hypothetical protein B0I36DRAFT_153374 [Microdochium trichocladiopsis]